RLGRDGGAHLVPRQSGQGRRYHRAGDQAMTMPGEDAGMRRLALFVACVAAAFVGIFLMVPGGQGQALVDDAVKSSWSTVAPEWQARLVQDETQKVCSQYRNAPPKAEADAIVAREKATIVYPADGKLMGDWKKGEVLAQSGY